MSRRCSYQTVKDKPGHYIFISSNYCNREKRRVQCELNSTSIYDRALKKQDEGMGGGEQGLSRVREVTDYKNVRRKWSMSNPPGFPNWY